MNSKALAGVCAIIWLVAVAGAQEKAVQFDLGTTLPPPELPKLPKWEIPEESGLRPIRLGKSDYVITGPLVDTFRPRPRGDEPRTLGQKLLELPIINMFVPAPWPRPTRQGKYFVWGERDVPWTVTAERQRPGPSGVLVSVAR